MYYRNYEDDYMRNIMEQANDPFMRDVMAPTMEQDLERMYPEVYRVVHPMVVEASSNVDMPITEEMLDRMVNDIYDRVESDGRINLNIENQFREDDRQFPGGHMHGRPPHGRPHHRNRFARDLIRVLLIRELLERRRRPHRPF